MFLAGISLQTASCYFKKDAKYLSLRTSFSDAIKQIVTGLEGNRQIYWPE